MKDFLKVYWPLVLLALAGLILALRFVEPAPPDSIRLATGSPGGAYHAYGERYRQLLGEQGVEVELVNSQGSVDNLRMLQDGDVDAALLQGGIAQSTDSDWLHTLGGLFYEPFWVFVRADTIAENFGDIAPARLAIGPEGSGTRALAIQIRSEYAGPDIGTGFSTLGGAQAASALIDGDLDAAAFSAGITASYVETLLKAPGIRVMAFPRAPGIARRQPALADITLLRGVVDIGKDLPPEDIPMIAAVAQLGISNDLHPAIQAILLEAADRIHSRPTLLAAADSFPSASMTDLEISKEALRYYRNGPSTLRRWFPFGVANFLERAWVLLIPLLTLLIPLVRAAPPLYRWRVRRKIYVWYRDLRELEARGRSAKTLAERDLTRQHLAQLQEEIGRLDVPLSYNDDLYRLRNHVAFVNHLLGNLDPKHRVDPMV